MVLWRHAAPPSHRAQQWFFGAMQPHHLTCYDTLFLRLIVGEESLSAQPEQQPKRSDATTALDGQQCLASPAQLV